MFNSEDKLYNDCVAEVIQPNLNEWHHIKKDVMSFQKEHFNLEEEDLIDAFKNNEATIVILRDIKTTKVVGFTYAEPVQKVYRQKFHPEREKLPHSVYIQNTAIERNYMGHKLIGKLMNTLEKELSEKGYEYLERDAVVANNYARNIQKRYGKQVVCAIPHSSKWGDQIFLRIKLISSEN